MHVAHVIIHLCIQHEQRLEAALLACMNKLELSYMLHTVIIHLCSTQEQTGAVTHIFHIPVPNKHYGFCDVKGQVQG